ncbi:HNH endonuclease signature motif containing protein [Brasilonema sp. UFV-L1]|uniref:HNH endonuclease n=1 Tax=Brasilonema sp. UFV-L1 TaxID=2234130 RepID=UPI00145E9CEF|nr:HNH endonuclease signature motif containing protein [Brasilonema sp. UFV-L1]NMG08975.1 hypothetical protein [Brasilonema sp. UFV-L1]
MNSKQRRNKKVQLVCEYGLCCWWCRCYLPFEKLTLDHLKPKSHGGSDSLENLRLACLSRICPLEKQPARQVRDCRETRKGALAPLSG